jgi:thiosulfate dehydrogenase [quinone] large subunit
MEIKKEKTPLSKVYMVTDPPAALSLFGKVSWAWIWIIPRLYVGWTWIKAGWGKITNPAWIGSQAGSALTGFVNGALAKTTGPHPDVQGWYGSYLQNIILPHAGTWGIVVSIGETLVGAGLILGAFTGIAAFFGMFMNLNYLMAGAVSVNPILLVISIFLVLAWKTAGWWGLDRWLLPALGTPWSPGMVFLRKKDL